MRQLVKSTNSNYRKNTNSVTEKKYYGVYTGVIEAVDGNRCYVSCDNINISRKKAEVIEIDGGDDSAAGIKRSVAAGRRCYIMFTGGNPSSPVVIGFVQSEYAGNYSLKEGDYAIVSPSGQKILIDNEKNYVELTNSNSYGIATSKSAMTLKHDTFKINASANKVAIDFDGRTQLRAMSGNVYFKSPGSGIISHNKLFETSVMKQEIVEGDSKLTVNNNYTIRANATGINSSKSFSVITEEFTNTVKTHSTVAAGSIGRKSYGGDIIDISNTGSVLIGAGGDAEIPSVEGINAQISYIELTAAGNIEIANLLSSVKHDPAGNVTSENTTFVNDSLVSFEIKANATGTIKAEATLNVESTALINIKSDGAIKSEGLTVTTKATSMAGIKAPTIFIAPTVPVIGVKVMTLLGPQMLLPDPSAAGIPV